MNSEQALFLNVYGLLYRLARKAASPSFVMLCSDLDYIIWSNYLTDNSGEIIPGTRYLIIDIIMVRMVLDK
ncbi:MAG: hypothetical protein GY705_27870 [Bacteroidetes bacterium]|nr:hypothetical protein [Bacteroidota bacterium]